jgi:hypothetical protein
MYQQPPLMVSLFRPPQSPALECRHRVNTVTAQQRSNCFVLLQFGRIATLLIELCDCNRNQNEQVTSLRILLLVIIGLNQNDRSCYVAPSLPDAALVSLPNESRLRSRLSSTESICLHFFLSFSFCLSFSTLLALSFCIGTITTSAFLSFFLSIFLSLELALLCLCLLFLAASSPFRFHFRLNGGFGQAFDGMPSACLHSLPFLSELALLLAETPSD